MSLSPATDNITNENLFLEIKFLKSRVTLESMGWVKVSHIQKGQQTHNKEADILFP